MLAYTTEVFFSVFAQYNAAIWPAQVIAYALGVLVVLLSLRPRKGSDKIIATCLAASWLWTGVVYHMMFFATIDWAAWAFGAAFAIEGILFAWTGAARGRLGFRFSPNLYGWAGLGLVIFSMAVYPLIGSLTGHGWPRAPMFGVAPSPTTIFTLGMLLLTQRRVPLHLTVIPVLWCLIGGTAAWLLNVPEDLALLLAGVSGMALVLWKNRWVALRERG
jgi:hypothetical protein